MFLKARQEILERPRLPPISANKARELQAQQLLDRRSWSRAQRSSVSPRVRLTSARALPLCNERFYLRRQILERTDVPIGHEPIEEDQRLNLVQGRSARLLSL
jgi:hypothetical protein